MEEVLVRYIHFLGIIILSSSLVLENILISKRMAREAFKKIVIIDAAYGMGAMITLAAGLLLWFVVGKPSTFYSTNYIFHAKLSLFILVAILSIFPTVFIIRRRRPGLEEIEIPKAIIVIKRFELLLISILPLLASIMARGYGNS